MEDHSIPDNKITASSTHRDSKVAWGRLHCSQGDWTPKADYGYQWLQVDFEPEVKLITHIATQETETTTGGYKNITSCIRNDKRPLKSTWKITIEFHQALAFS